MYGLPGAHVGQDPAARFREAEKWIAQRLLEIDYDLTHPEAQLLADHLQAVAVGTLVAMQRSNELLDACEKLTMCTLPSPPDSWNNESQRLIVVSARAAIADFITRSMREWDPQGDAIDTDFINHCLFEFKKIYLEYCKEQLQERAEPPAGDAIGTVEAGPTEGDSEDIGQEFNTIVLMTARGLGRAQIAAELGISPSSLDRRIAGYRRKLEHAGRLIDNRRDGEQGRG